MSAKVSSGNSIGTTNGNTTTSSSSSTMFSAAKYKPSNSSPLTQKIGHGSGKPQQSSFDALDLNTSGGSGSSTTPGARGTPTTGVAGGDQRPTSAPNGIGRDDTLSLVEQRLRIVKRGRSTQQRGSTSSEGGENGGQPARQFPAGQKPPCDMYPAFNVVSKEGHSKQEREALEALCAEVIDGSSFPDVIAL